MSDIVLSKGVRQNLLTLQNTAALLGQTQERLATGKKVNSALDNPINFFTASGLQSRAGDLSRLLDSIGNAVQTVQAADKGISAITKLIQSAQASARQALTTAVPGAGGGGAAVEVEASFTSDDAATTDWSDDNATFLAASEAATLTINGIDIEIDADNTTVEDVLIAINDIEDISAEVNGDGDLVISASNGASIEIEITGAEASDFAAAAGIPEATTIVPVMATTEARVVSDGATVDYTDDGATVLGTGEEADLTINGETLNLDDTTTVQDVLDFINDIEGLSAEVVNGTLHINGSDGASIEIGIVGTDAAALETALGITDGTEAEPPAAAPAGGNGPAERRANLQADYNLILQQITELARDASFNGVNLINGDNLTVTFNEDGSSTLTINGVDFTAAGLGLTELSGEEFQTNEGVQAAIAQLDAATNSLRSQASAFGSNLSIIQARQDFTKNMISVLQVGADNLVLADSNEEGANMLALNTRQQLSTVALSLASQADQNVLRLF